MGRDLAGLLLERDAELAELDGLTIAAATGDGCVVLVEGAAGIGKSRLLAGTRTAAANPDEREALLRGGSR